MVHKSTHSVIPVETGIQRPASAGLLSHASHSPSTPFGLRRVGNIFRRSCVAAKTEHAMLDSCFPPSLLRSFGGFSAKSPEALCAKGDRGNDVKKLGRKYG